MPTLEADIEAHDNEESSGKIWSFAGKITESFDPAGCVFHAPCGQRTACNQGDGQAKTETKNEGEPQGEFFQLQTYEQNRERSRARHQTAGKSEKNNLTGRDVPVCEPLGYVICMGAGAGVLILTVGHIDAVMLMVILTELEIVGMGVIAVRQHKLGVELMRLRQFVNCFQVFTGSLETKILENASRADGFYCQRFAGRDGDLLQILVVKIQAKARGTLVSKMVTSTKL